jgi:hypothetical protein
MSDLKTQIFERINYLRLNPHLVKEKGTGLNTSSYNKKPAKDLKLSEELSAAADEYLSYGRTKYGYDEDELKIHLNHYVEGYFSCVMLVGEKEFADDIVDNMLAKSNGNSLLNRNYNYIGIANKAITIIILSDGADKIKPKSFEDQLFDEINQLRQHPKSFIKYAKIYLNDKKRSTTNLMNYLLTLRSYKPLKYDIVLRKACKEYGELSNYSDSELKEHLLCFGSGFRHAGQVKKNGYENAVELIMNILSETDDYVNNILFSKLFNYVGLHHDEETKRTIIIFTDKISDRREFEKSKTVTRKVNRPQLTSVEIDQIKSDFKKLDVLNQGIIKPNIILTFTKESNPIYIQALRMLDNTDNNTIGINCELFTTTITNILALNTDFRDFYDLLCGTKRSLTADTVFNHAKELNYQTSEGEIKDLVDNISEGGIGIKNTQFINLMKIVCNLK